MTVMGDSVATSMMTVYRGCGVASRSGVYPYFSFFPVARCRSNVVIAVCWCLRACVRACVCGVKVGLVFKQAAVPKT